MKKIRILQLSALIILCIAVIVVFVGLATGVAGRFAPTFLRLSRTSSMTELLDTERFELEGVEDLDLRLIVSGLRIVATDADEIVIEHDRDARYDDNYKLFYELRGDRLIIEEESIRGFSFFSWSSIMSTSSVTIYLPNAYDARVVIEQVSGRVQMDGDYMLEELRINAVSGRITIDSLEADYARLSNVSGAIIIREVKTQQLEVNTVSGAIDLGHMVAAGRAKTVSGKMTLVVDELIGDLRLETVSGGANLTVPDDASYYLDTSTVSGKVNITGIALTETRGNNYTIGEDASIRITFDGVSGSLNISGYAA